MHHSLKWLQYLSTDVCQEYRWQMITLITSVALKFLLFILVIYINDYPLNGKIEDNSKRVIKDWKLSWKINYDYGLKERWIFWLLTYSDTFIPLSSTGKYGTQISVRFIDHSKDSSTKFMWRSNPMQNMTFFQDTECKVSVLQWILIQTGSLQQS